MAEHTTLRDLWESQVVARADAEFLVFEDPATGRVQRHTYAQFGREVARAANLLAGLGVGKGDRVAVQLCNRVEFVECFLALACIGAVLVPINSSLTPPEREHIIGECGVGLLVTEAEETTSAADVLTLECYGRRKPRQATVISQRPPLAPNDLAEIMYTSGTTSTPKGVMITQANMVFSGRYVAWELAMRPEDRYLTCMAVTHVNFQLSALVPAVHAGCTLVLQRRYSARTMWDRVRRHDATLVQAMAMIVRTLLRQPVAPAERDHRVREVHYFLPLTEGEKSQFEERFGVRLLNNYGSTETLVGSITDYPSGPRRWPSIGRAGPGYEVRIAGSGGQPVPAGQCGQIQIRGRAGVSLMAGYWNDPEATAAAIDAEGWYSTGDAGYVDEQGWVYFTDRLGDLIKRAGENISAAEIERVLLSHPDVADVAVIGVPDEVRDEAVKAIVVPAAGRLPSKSGLRAFAARSLACFKVPEIIEFRASLPRGQYGKIDRNRLRERHRNGYQD
ncbi:MAG: AMP-binding protein [Actinomycetaceae bacterium]|nr:AMP-binding protein [Actinomycetaceae bacterium]